MSPLILRAKCTGCVRHAHRAAGHIIVLQDIVELRRRRIFQVVVLVVMVVACAGACTNIDGKTRDRRESYLTPGRRCVVRSSAERGAVRSNARALAWVVAWVCPPARGSVSKGRAYGGSEFMAATHSSRSQRKSSEYSSPGSESPGTQHRGEGHSAARRISRIQALTSNGFLPMALSHGLPFFFWKI